MADFLDDDLDEEDEAPDLEAADEDVEEVDPLVQIAELRHKLDLLQKTKEAQRSRYKKEMHLIVQALIEKHRDLQKENHFLQKQIHQVMGEGQEEDFLAELKETISSQKQEVVKLKKLVQQYQEQDSTRKEDVAELETLREILDEKDQFIQDLEGKNQEFVFQLEAKDNIISRISTQVANLEAEVYALNKRMRASGDDQTKQQIDELNELKKKLGELEEKKNYFEQLARRAYEKAQEAESKMKAVEEKPSIEVSAPPAPGDETEYEEAMDMLLEELQENLTTYDEISSQFSKARV